MLKVSFERQQSSAVLAAEQWKPSMVITALS